MVYPSSAPSPSSPSLCCAPSASPAQPQQQQQRLIPIFSTWPLAEGDRQLRTRTTQHDAPCTPIKQRETAETTGTSEMETLTAASSSIICTKPVGPLGSPARAPNHRALQALQQRVLDLTLERLANCLSSPCDRAREACLELGVAHGDLEAAFRRRQQQCCVGEQKLDGVCEVPSQVRP